MTLPCMMASQILAGLEAVRSARRNTDAARTNATGTASSGVHCFHLLGSSSAIDIPETETKGNITTGKQSARAVSLSAM